MKVTTVWAWLRRDRTLRMAGMVAGVIVVFGLGVLFGNGTIRLVPHGGYGDVTGLPTTLDYSSINEVYDAIRQNYDGKLTEDQVLDGVKHGLAKAANDPYTEYFTPSEASEFNKQLQGVSLTGIGVELDQNSAGSLVVVSPIDGSPAQQAGVMAGDVITSIDGKSTADMSVTQAVQKIRGPKGSKVTIKIIRGDSESLEFTITRDTISVPTASSKILDGNVGYLRVSQFSGNTLDLVQQAVDSFKQAGVKKVILDLRDNPGGEVDVAQHIASLWLPAGSLIMQEKRGSQVVDSYYSVGEASLKGMPTVVLVNNGSASASEITALALRDAKVATIVGEKTYGKGVVQQVLAFSDGSQLKVTIAKWYSPKGASIDHQGIQPDKVVTMSDEDVKAGKDTQLQTAQDYLQNK